MMQSNDSEYIKGSKDNLNKEKEVAMTSQCSSVSEVSLVSPPDYNKPAPPTKHGKKGMTKPKVNDVLQVPSSVK